MNCVQLIDTEVQTRVSPTPQFLEHLQATPPKTQIPSYHRPRLAPEVTVPNHRRHNISTPAHTQFSFPAPKTLSACQYLRQHGSIIAESDETIRLSTIGQKAVCQQVHLLHAKWSLSTTVGQGLWIHSRETRGALCQHRTKHLMRHPVTVVDHGHYGTADVRCYPSLREPTYSQSNNRDQPSK